MNTASLKKYAPAARRAFIAAVTARAAAFGLTAKGVTPMTEKGDVVLIGDKPYPRSVTEIRRKLEQRIKQQGFVQVIEAMAYTWFNRLVAIRYMELHGYLDHGRRVLSHPDKPGGFEILDASTEIELPGLDRNRVFDLKLDGSKDEELYRLLLLGQCRALHQAMPFLFEAIEDETELLLPDNLTKTDTLIRRLVDDIPEEDWQQVEIVGWLYQFYISEKKDQVIGKVVKSQDIPAATQLFTPNWIVKYMVQNSLGAQWLATYPDSPLRQQMEYYIEPAEQTEEVQAQLQAITPTSLNPEEVTLMDPACGSGHILVEAYELFKAIYLERGYRQLDIPKLILEKNLYGLEIDPRAAQLTGFALMMKGRADDRRLFEGIIKLNVMALQDRTDFDPERVPEGVNLAEHGLKLNDLKELKQLFEHVTTFGSLIQVPERLAAKLPALKRLSEAASEDLFVSAALKRLRPLVQQAELLAAQYHTVVANPPYMGGKFMNTLMRQFTKRQFPLSKSDLFSVSAQRFLEFTKANGFVGLMTPFTWMFLKSYQDLRELILGTKTLYSLIHPEYHAIWSSAAVPICTFVAQNQRIGSYTASFIKLTDFYGEAVQPEKTLEAIANPDCGWMYRANTDDFKKVPGNPVAYWMSGKARQAFEAGTPLGDIASPRKGNSTSDNNRFLRIWPEVSSNKIGLSLESYSSDFRWIPYNKGGGFLKWYGHNTYLIDWKDRGREIRIIPTAVIANEALFFKPGLTWGTVTSAHFSIRWFENGFIFDNGGCCVFGADEIRPYLMALMNSCVFPAVIGGINPTLNFQSGDVSKFPVITSEKIQSKVSLNAAHLLSSARDDWDVYERSWDFQSLPLLTASSDPATTLESSYTSRITQNRDTIAEMKRLEEENNRLFIDAYDLADELTPDVPIEQITLTVNPAYRYGGKLTEEEQWARFREDTMQELVSYAIGCMMGRYSLDEPGLIYAHSGNEGFDPSRYPIFPADDDGIIPLTDTEWFDDDAAHRLIEFISVTWGKSHLEANLTFLADNLSPRNNESSRDTLRRYLCDNFFKDHLKTYKSRPIYWLFSSGKHKAFQCLVYLHRYNEGTLARMRTEYVIPLQGLIASRIERLDADILAASSTAHRKRLEKEKDKLVKQRAELQKFDEKLRHYADQRIKLDLDDGVKINYSKFGDLLAEVKKITGE